ncbi:MAG: signal peptidase I [Gemmatimonadota bacterium]|nr:signal peptidase I [Gemmatimonadota bacterium]MDH3421438.1 signal peptidase I [Gemmatimonadota bacterium]
MTDKKKAKGREKRPDSLAEWVKSLAIAFVLFLFLRTFIVQTFIITSGSMEETLLVGDMLVVNRLAMGSRFPGTELRIPGYSSPDYGDVLVFDPPHDDTLKLIKRLVGMGGDTLEMRSRVLYRNGAEVSEPYVAHHNVPDESDYTMEWQRNYLTAGADVEAYAPSRDNWGPLVIPEDRFFMLGDNRELSYDSRYWGLLERWRLEGRAAFIYYAFDGSSYRPFPWLREVRWGRIGDRIR